MFSLLSLKLPGFDIDINSKDISSTYKVPFTDFNNLLATFLNLAFVALGFLMLYNLVLGAVRYLSAGDSKENVQKARQRIIWAIFGFLVVIASFSVAQFARTLIPQQSVPLTPITKP